MATSRSHHPKAPRVVVLGAGPVGLAIAGALRDRGFPVEVFEKREMVPHSGGVIQVHVEGLAALWYFSLFFNFFLCSRVVGPRTEKLTRSLLRERFEKKFADHCDTVIDGIDITTLGPGGSSDDQPVGKLLHHVDLVKRCHLCCPDFCSSVRVCKVGQNR